MKPVAIPAAKALDHSSQLVDPADLLLARCLTKEIVSLRHSCLQAYNFTYRAVIRLESSERKGSSESITRGAFKPAAAQKSKAFCVAG